MWDAILHYGRPQAAVMILHRAQLRQAAFGTGCVFALVFAFGFAELSLHAASDTGTTTPSSSATAGIAPPATGTATPPKSFWTGDYLSQQWLGVRDKWQAAGITFRPDWTGEVFGNVSGGVGRGVVSDGVFELPLTLDFDPLTSGAVKDLTFKVNAFYIYGTNLSSAFVHDFSVSSNIAAYNSIRLDELWIQKGLWNNMVTIKVGNQAIDNEFFISNSAALFIGSTFGTPTLLANNIPFAPQYPLASPGVRIEVQPDPHSYVMAGVYGLDDGLAQDTNDKNGTRFALNADSGMLVMAETGYLLNQGKGESGACRARTGSAASSIREIFPFSPRRPRRAKRGVPSARAARTTASTAWSTSRFTRMARATSPSSRGPVARRRTRTSSTTMWTAGSTSPVSFPGVTRILRASRSGDRM